MSQPPLGPQYQRDDRFTSRMRLHQSWYRATVLGVRWGTGPQPSSRRELGSMLDSQSAQRGLNFLTPDIFGLAQQRIAQGNGTVDAFRLLHNMLSSQPMCFNLFGPLALDLNLATAFLQKLIGDRVSRATRVVMEYAPVPASEYLNDRTAFDAFIEYQLDDGSLGFVGIETKLTEPFSQKEYDGPAYRRWCERAGSPWHPEAWPHLADVSHNQLWRDHLLAIAMLQHGESSYSEGVLLLVHHPMDEGCRAAAKTYGALLSSGCSSFIEADLGRVVDLLEPVVTTDDQRQWIKDFRKRYLHLSPSESAGQATTVIG